MNYLVLFNLKNQYCEVFYDKLTFLFIEMPRLTKTENELKTHFDKWLYFLKNLEDFTV
ncbi:MAG: PD-(D/E)XK nuclease family transposase [Leptospiraceae bacterium]|nr:PD-(D/E)XK nuclease family transposase [Leptospiraceae bacterium]